MIIFGVFTFLFNPKSKQINHDLYVRLVRYKDIKKQVDEFTEWEDRHQHKLIVAWTNYCKTIELIPYGQFCEDFYNGTLKHVLRKSYVNAFK